MWTDILVRYGEIFLKGKNRGMFERKLKQNMQKIASLSKIQELRSRYVVPYFSGHGALKRVFGITSYSPALLVEKDLEKIKQNVVFLLKDKKGTFRVETNRADKRFLPKSPEINMLVGRHIEDNTSLEFQLKNPDVVVHIEINQQAAYIFTDVVKCFGGLPTGVEGKVLVLIEDEKSLLATLLFMKRGCSVYPVAFEDKDISLLQKYSPEELTLYFGSMEKIETYAKEKNITSLVVANSFHYNGNMTLFRPLIGFNTFEIKEKLNLLIPLAYSPVVYSE